MKFKKIIVLIILLGNIIMLPAQDSTLKPNPNLKEVIVVFKTHFDIGYTDYAESVIRKYGSSMIEGALKNLEASKMLPEEDRFVWTLPGWPMEQILKRANPENRQKVETALKEGYFVVHALPFTVETEASDPESMIRGLEFSSNIAKKYGMELPRDAKMTDVPSHSWFLPSLLKNAGVDFLHLGCNPASQSPEIPVLFWWEGPDGSRLMTMYWEKYYGTDLVSPEDWPFKTWLALIPTNDNQGAPPAEEVERTLSEIRRLAPNAIIKTGRLSDFYDALILEKPDLPVVRGDMPDTWIHGYLSMPKEVAASKHLKDDLYSFEGLNAQLNLWLNSSDDVSELVQKSAESLLLFDEHTFGMAMSHGHSGTWAYDEKFTTLKSQGVYESIEKSWAEKGDRVWKAEKMILPNYKDELNRLAVSINTSESHITVYNPLPWSRSGLVKLQIHSGSIKGKSLKDSSTGELLAFSNEGNVIEFLAVDVPANGYKTYFQNQENPPDEKGLVSDTEKYTFENQWFRIVMDPQNGGIKSLFDKKQNKEVINTNSAYGFGNYMYERFSKEQVTNYANRYIKGGWNWAMDELGRPGLDDRPYDRKTSWKGSMSWQEDDLKISAIMHFEPTETHPQSHSLIVTLYQNLPYVEIKWAIHGKKPEPWPEAGWMPFSLAIDQAIFKAGRLGAVVDPTKDFIKGSNFDYYFLNTGIAIVDPTGKGYGISSPDVPGISLDRPGLWTFTGNFIPEKPNVFFNLFNNQWSTNFTEWIEGSWNTRFYLWSIEDYENEQDLITPSIENRVQLQGAFSPGHNGSLPLSKDGIKISRKGITLSAFKKYGQGEEHLIRIIEQSGQSGECTIELPSGITVSQAQSVNLRGVLLDESIAVKNNRFTFALSAYQAKTFILDLSNIP